MSAQQKSTTITNFLTSWLTVITMISAAIFGILEYVDHKQGVRVQRSLDYVQRYNADLYLKLRNRLADVLEDESKDLIETLGDDSLTAEQVQRKYSRFINAMIKKHKLKPDLRRLLGFHEEVVLCANAQLCDSTVVRSFFTVDALELFKGFYPYICDQREKWKNKTIAAELETFYMGDNNETCRVSIKHDL